MRAFSSLCRGLVPRNERRKDTTGEVEPVRVAPGLDGPEEDDAVLTCRDGIVQGAFSKSSRSMKLEELVLLLRLSLRMSASQSGISASGVLGVDMPEGGLYAGSKPPPSGTHPVAAVAEF